MGIETLRDFLLWVIAVAYALLFLGFLFYMGVDKWKRRHLSFGRHLPEQESEVPE